jgi:hypothetical protein
MTSAESSRKSWWGETPLAESEAAHWRIGPLRLAAHRGRREWQLTWEWEPSLVESQDWELRRSEELPEEPAHHERFVVGETGDRIALRPALADRPVVSSPRLPFHLLPERETTLYVGSPAWVRVAAGEPPTDLCELPSRRPSDTWFGGATGDGELCYATQTRALLHLDNLPVLHRSVVTPILIRNQAASQLFLERLKLPVPLLSVYCDRDGRLWTEGVTLTRTEESGMAALEVRDGPPREAVAPELLTAARTTAEPNLWIRAFSSLLGFARNEEEPR